MYLYNITIKIEQSIHEDWLAWMKDIYIPKLLSFARFTGYKFYRILQLDDTDGPTYALQLFADEMKCYDEFITLHHKEIEHMQQQAWGSHMLTFSTLMEIVH
ncbi:MAG: DUF4286 family protein [Arachidicoccus sp.]|nr:DUF4286 family protein [Arachidicoccus sp.]